jgi:5'-deoxynucleotidase YfbR-like HD superfamily hydrolase
VTPWLSTFTRRWHCNPHLAHTVDPVGYHGARMAVLALEYWGAVASRELLVACICHDLGEWATGDVPYDAKRDAALKAHLDRIEDAALHKMGLAFSLSLDDQRRLKFLDRLDAYLWAEHHAPGLMARDDWKADQAWLAAEREALGISC